jgi:hypothetical protein
MSSSTRFSSTTMKSASISVSRQLWIAVFCRVTFPSAGMITVPVDRLPNLPHSPLGNFLTQG